MRHLKIGLVGLGFAMLLTAGVVLWSGANAKAEMRNTDVSVRASNGEIALNVPTDTALTAFDRFLDRFMPKAESVKESVFSAVASLDMLGDHTSINGVRTSGAGRSETFIQASTTLCSFEAPAATSTIANRNASIQINVASTSQATIVSIVRSQSPSGISTTTDTQIGTDFEVPATGNVLIQASTTGITTNAGVSNLLFSNWILLSATTTSYQKEYLVFMLSNAVVNADDGTGQYTPTGHCQSDGFLEL